MSHCQLYTLMEQQLNIFLFSGMAVTYVFSVDNISFVSSTIKLPDKTLAKLQKVVEKPKPTV